MHDIRHIIKGEVDSTDATRRAYSHDASIFEVAPKAVIYPKTTGDIQKLITFASNQRREGTAVSLTVRNAGTCMSGGPLNDSYIVDVSRHINHIGHVDTENRSVWVQGGAMHIDVEKATHPKHLLFAPYTSSRDICGIGGMLGNNASGEKSVKYGPTSRNVSKVKVALSDGEIYEFEALTTKEVNAKKQLPTFEGRIYREMTKLLEENRNLIDQHHPRTAKNAAGYPLWELWDAQQSHLNLARLFIGAQGTLGIITEAKLKLVPMAKYERMIVVPIEKLSNLATAVQTAMKHRPVTCEMFDNNTYVLAEQYHPEDAKRAIMAKGMHMVVMVVFEGDTQEQADKLANKAKVDIEKHGYKISWVEDKATADSLLLIRRKNYKMLLEHPHKNMRAVPFLEDTIVPLDMYGEFLAALESILNQYDMTYVYAGHIGDGSIRLIPLVNMEEEGAAEKIMHLETRVNDLVIAMDGSISVDHNDGIIRTPYLPQFFGEEMYTLFAKVKELFDPLGIFNPGKKVGGSMDYTKQHIVRSNHPSN